MFVFLRGGSATTTKLIAPLWQRIIRDTDVSKSLIAASDEAVNQPPSRHYYSSISTPLLYIVKKVTKSITCFATFIHFSSHFWRDPISLNILLIGGAMSLIIGRTLSNPIGEAEWHSYSTKHCTLFCWLSVTFFC